MIDNMVLDKKYKNLGIHLSGGADSSIIYYALCEFYKDDPDAKIYVATQQTVWKPAYVEAAKNIIKIVGMYTGKYPEKHYTHVNTSHNSRESPDESYAAGIQEIRSVVQNEVDIDVWYNGVTSNPSVEVLHPLIDKLAKTVYKEPWMKQAAIDCTIGMNPEREQSFTKANRSPVGHKTFVRKDGSTYQYLNSHPFVQQDKMATYKAYKDLGMLEDLYPWTFSCEGPVENQNYHGIDTEHCGYCLFCLERYYAFGKLR